MSNLSLKVSRISLSQLFSSLASLNRSEGGSTIIDDDWVEVVDRELSSGSGDEDEIASVKGIACEMDDQEDDKLSTSRAEYFKVKYKVLSKAEILRQLEDKITKVSTVLLLPRDDAAIILKHFKWDVNQSLDEWMTSEERVRKKVGLYVRPVVETPTDAAENACRICDEDFPRDLLFSASCGHQFCRPCWEGYISEAISDDSLYVALQCPEFCCDAAVGFHLIALLLSDDEKIMFETHLLQSYLAGNSEAKWCPAPDCNFVVFSSNDGEGMVTCWCLYRFCWNCSREAHAPVECYTVAKWMSEIPLQSENWVLANTVICPNCKSQYEKAFWSQNTSCDVCDQSFCCACGEPGDNWEDCWTHACSSNGDNDTNESLKKSLEKYNCHYEGWTACESARVNALSDLKVFKDLQLSYLCAILDLPSTEFDFIAEALGQVVECWQLLKWTYVYGYYLPDDLHKEKELLEFKQGIPISVHDNIVEVVHICLFKPFLAILTFYSAGDARYFLALLQKPVGDLHYFLDTDDLFVNFSGFKDKINKSARVMRKYCHQLMESLMDDELLEMEKQGRSSNCQRSSCPKLEISREGGENSCSQISPNASPCSKVIRRQWQDDKDVSSPVGSTKSDDSWVLSECEFEV